MKLHGGQPESASYNSPDLISTMRLDVDLSPYLNSWMQSRPAPDLKPGFMNPRASCFLSFLSLLFWSQIENRWMMQLLYRSWRYTCKVVSFTGNSTKKTSRRGGMCFVKKWKILLLKLPADTPSCQLLPRHIALQENQPRATWRCEWSMVPRASPYIATLQKLGCPNCSAIDALTQTARTKVVEHNRAIVESSDSKTLHQMSKLYQITNTLLHATDTWPEASLALAPSPAARQLEEIELRRVVAFSEFLAQ